MEKLIYSTAEIVESLEKIIDDGGAVSLVVTGNSMSPFLKEGRDTVILEKCTERDFTRGKILLFKRENGAIVLHRVRKVLSDDKLEMNGDAQYWCETVEKSQVIGAVRKIFRDGKELPCTKNTLWHILKPLRPIIFGVKRKFLEIRSNTNGETDRNNA